MATTYDKASLVMIPSGYKDDKLYSIKPTDGSGDFTFSRDGAGASPATRVNASGLIEKGRENLLTYSNDFSNAAWIKLGAGTGTAASVTSGFSDPDGGSNAWRLQCDLNGGTTSSDQSLIYQSGTGTGVHTYSYYVKSNTGANQTFSFGNDLNGYTQGVATTSWQRFEVFVNSASHTNAYIGARGTTGSDDTLDILVFAAQKESGLVATDYIETTTAPVSAGLLGDMPRLDYSGGATCPSLLLEPSRVNLVTQSEYFNSWSTAGTTPVFTNNYGISPEGLQNSTRVQLDNSDIFYQSVGLSQGAYVFSVFGKAISGGSSQIILRVDIPSAKRAVFDLSNGTIVTNTADDADIIDYGNGWYRCVLIQNNDTIANAVIEEYSDSLDCEIWGAQLESGSYPTSYIATYGSASTRGADSCSGAGDSSTFNSEGVLFVETSGESASTEYRAITISDGTSSNRVQIWLWNNGTIFTYVVAGGTTSYSRFDSYDVSNTNKIALKYKANEFSTFINGTKTSTDLSGAAPTGLNDLSLNDIGGTAKFFGEPKQIITFPTALTDAECIALTTI